MLTTVSAIIMAMQQPASQPVQGCTIPQMSQFDFWVGEWNVYPNGKEPKKENQVAHSRIEKLYGGCAIRENWMPFKGPGGGSLNSYDPDTGRWHQTWVGSSLGRVEFTGGAAPDGRMVLTGFWKHVGGPGKHALIRMTYTRQQDGSVRQHGEASADNGLTWTNSFDFIYRKRKEPIPK